MIQRKHKEYELIKMLNTCRISTLLAKCIACANRGKLYLFFIPAGIIGSDTSIQGGHVCHVGLTVGFVDRIHMRLIKFEINMNRLVSNVIKNLLSLDPW